MAQVIPLEFRDFFFNIVKNIYSFSDINQSSKQLDSFMHSKKGGSVHNLTKHLTDFYQQDYINALKNRSLDDIKLNNNIANLQNISSRDLVQCFFVKDNGKYYMNSFQDNPLCNHILSEIEDEYHVEHLNDVIKKIYFSSGILFKNSIKQRHNLNSFVKECLEGNNFMENGDWRIIFRAMKKDHPHIYKRYMSLLDTDDYQSLPKNTIIRLVIPGKITKKNIVAYISLIFLCKILFRLTPKSRIKDSLFTEHFFFIMGHLY